MKYLRRKSARRRKQRGSALLVSLMVMVGLSMLGLGFVAISETESAIAVNERNAIEAQAAAEAAARLVVEWFQDPDWALAQNLMPPNDGTYPNIKTTRFVSSSSGVYKATSGTKLFDKPYKPANEHRFYGTEESADVIIDTATASTIIDNINTALFGSTTASPRITSIRVYAPPISGGALQADPANPNMQFWVGGTRYGVATISATAAKFQPANSTNAIATRKVRIVVGEFPVPQPAGPIQSATGAISYGGSSNVHWGQELAAGDLDDRKLVSALPWANPYEIVHFERGYDDVVWPTIGGTNFDQWEYLGEVLGKSYGDPWFGLRATGTLVTSPVDQTPIQYAYQLDEDAADGNRHANFHQQTTNDYPWQKEITFPRVDFDFWRRVAMQGRGTKGIYYFKYSGPSSPASTGGMFKRNGVGTAQTIPYWVNTIGGAQLDGGDGGFYFFDTLDGSNPQGDATPALTPEIEWSSSEVSGVLMRGFIYFNATQFRTTGSGSTPDRDCNMPGEPFRDIGYRRWNATTNAWAVDATGALVHEGAADKEFSYQDLNGNGRFDVVTRQDSFTINDSGSTTGTTSSQTFWVPRTWTSGCTMPPANWNGSQDATGATYCSEPHEPYLNMIYPTTSSGSVQVAWQQNDQQSQRVKATGATCPASTTTTTPANIPTQCTSNAYDVDGAFVGLPILADGLIYVEGTYDNQGNADIYGAILAGGAVTGNGSTDFWFKEALTRRDYLPPGAPRVIAYSVQTDDVD